MNTDTETEKKCNCDAIDRQAGRLYDAYCVAVGGKAFNGDILPLWVEFSLDPKKQLQANAWREVARLSLTK